MLTWNKINSDKLSDKVPNFNVKNYKSVNKLLGIWRNVKPVGCLLFKKKNHTLKFFYLFLTRALTRMRKFKKKSGENASR